MKSKATTSTDATVPVALPLAKLTPRPDNRHIADDAALGELADSLKVVGQLHAIHVRTLGAGYEILAGVRRWMAAQKNGATTIDAVVHADCDEAVADTIRLAENEHRQEPTALDTARGLRRIKNLNGFSYAEVAVHTSISLPSVKRYLGIFSASDALLAAIEKERASLGLAVELVRFEKEQGELAGRKLLKRLAAGDLTAREVGALRKRRGQPAGGKGRQADSTPRDPWQTVEKRIATLAAADPAAARARLEAVLARLDEPEASPS